MLLNVHRNCEDYSGQGKGGGGERERDMHSLSILRPTKTKETVLHQQNNNVKEAEAPPGQSNLRTSLIAASTAVQSKVTVFKKQLLRNN